jgi:hypothetical protein
VLSHETWIREMGKVFRFCCLFLAAFACRIDGRCSPTEIWIRRCRDLRLYRFVVACKTNEWCSSIELRLCKVQRVLRPCSLAITLAAVIVSKIDDWCFPTELWIRKM